tara:strand:+ start:1781 stop:2380 length:600 start_codon:yes stop_codon:yes gene_type:complete
MSSILYYSNYCKKCETLLQKLSKSTKKKDIHFVCIDNRVNENNKVYIILQNGKKIILPSNVNKVPALLLLDKQNEVMFGDSIQELLQPDFYQEKHNDYSEQQFQQQQNQEPMAFSLSGNNFVMSDNYSFLDMSSDDLNAKGNGGTRQLHNYVTIDQNNTIYTPTDNYTPDKIGDGEVSIESLMEARNKEVPQQQQGQFN